MSGHSEELPLRAPGGEDVSMGGRFWVQFRDADAAQRDALEGAWYKDKVKRGGDIEREYGSVAVMDLLIEHKLIRGANLPRIKDDDELGDLAWPRKQEEQKRLVRPDKQADAVGLPWPLMQIIISMAMDFYMGIDAAVGELGNSSTTSASSPSEPAEETSSSL
jgi:hypothetical protein